MFTAVISILIRSFSDIFWKKSLTYGVGGKAHDLLSYSIAGIIIIYFFYKGIDLENFDIKVLFVVFVIFFVSVMNIQIAQKTVVVTSLVGLGFYFK